jgi:hypothetical protein
MLCQVEHKVKISYCRRVCNYLLTNTISFMISYSYVCGVSVPNFTRVTPIILHSSSPRTRVPYQNFLSPPYNFIFHHPLRKNIKKKLPSTVSKVSMRESTSHIYTRDNTVCQKHKSVPQIKNQINTEICNVMKK